MGISRCLDKTTAYTGRRSTFAVVLKIGEVTVSGPFKAIRAIKKGSGFPDPNGPCGPNDNDFFIRYYMTRPVTAADSTLTRVDP